MPEPPLNDLQQELDTLDLMCGALSPREADLFRSQVLRVVAAMQVLLGGLRDNHDALRRVVAEAVDDVRLDLVAQEHDLEATRRERDDLRGGT